ncbi:winged helix-turn-helix domain-containing protein [Aeromonas salmonicida]|uniref:winged helix-turn-helix domain-containing protein n=1 Tax=Aeromonas salmonicida TaxID=645 RepID=UPI003D23663D
MSNRYLFDDVIVDCDESFIAKGENKLVISFTEAKTLEFLLLNSGEIVAKDEIKAYAWGGRVVSDASITKAISNLRSAFVQCGLTDDIITTVARMGYKISNDFIKVEDKGDSSNGITTNEYIQIQPPPSSSRMSIKSKMRLVIKSKVYKHYTIASTIIIVLMSVYNMVYLSPLDFKKEFIAPGYEIKTETINNKPVNIVSRSTVKIPYELLEKITGLSPGSTVYFDSYNDTLTLSYYDKYTEHADSYIFSLQNTHRVIESINYNLRIDHK